MSRKTPARKVEIRVRAPEALTLIMVWPIIAQPPMPPKKPVTTLATPWPQASRVLWERVSVTSSTSLAVMSDSSSPTKAMARAKGKMICRVSRLNGTFGMNSVGRESGRSPLSPTVGTATAAKTVMSGQDHDGDQRRRDGLGELRQAEDDDQTQGHQRVDQPRDAEEFGDLGHEDQDGQGVDEADHDRAGNEPHELGDPGESQDDLEDAGKDDGGDEVVHAVGLHQRGDDQGDRAGGRGNHGRAPADEGDGHGHGEGGEESDPRVDAGDDREGDGFRDQGQSDDESGEDLGLEPARRHQGSPHGLELFRSECRRVSGFGDGHCWLRSWSRRRASAASFCEGMRGAAPRQEEGELVLKVSPQLPKPYPNVMVGFKSEQDGGADDG